MLDRFIGELKDDLDRGAREAKRPMVDTRLAAEAIVAVVFTVGAEALDLPPASRKPLTERIIQEVRIIMRGAQALARRSKSPAETPDKAD